MLYPSLSFRNTWNPTEIDTALWLDASDASTIDTDAGRVTQWRDKSGNDRHVFRVAVGPALSIFNGLVALAFTANNEYLQSAASITTGTYTGDFNVYWVATRNSTGGAIITERSNPTVATSQWLYTISAYFISSDGADSTSNHEISSTTFDLIDSNGGIVSHLHSPGLRDVLFVDGNPASVLAGTASNISGGTDYFRIGRRESFLSGLWQGLICEIIVSLNNQATDERQRIEGYLAHKWGLSSNLPASHPYKNKPPT